MHIDTVGGGASTYYVSHYDDSDNKLVCYVDNTDGVSLGINHAAHGTDYAASIETVTAGYWVFDWLVDLGSATGLQIFINSVEVTYGQQDDPTLQAEISNDGDFYLGHATSSYDGKIFNAFMRTYIPTEAERQSWFAHDRRFLGI